MRSSLLIFSAVLFLAAGVSLAPPSTFAAQQSVWIEPMLWLVDGKFRRREEISQEQLERLEREDPELRILTPRRMLGMGCRLVAVSSDTRRSGRIFAEYQTWLSVGGRWRQAVQGQDSHAAGRVWTIISKSGHIFDQFSWRSDLRQNTTGLDPCSAEVLSIWPVAGAGQLFMGSIPSGQDIPEPWEIDMVAYAWALHDFDPRSVAALREASLRSQSLPPIRPKLASDLAQPFARELAGLMDQCPAASLARGKPTYAQLIDRYATPAVDAVASIRDPEAQLAALHGWLMQWIGDVGVVDLKTSLTSGVFDCDPLSLVAAEALARLGWEATLLREEVESWENGKNNATIRHILLQVAPPVTGATSQRRAWLYDPAGGSAIGLSESRIREDPSQSTTQELRLWTPQEAFENEFMRRTYIDE